MKVGQKFCFVAKANCYGFGVKICRFFNDFVDYFAVSSADEFFDLKKNVTKNILVLSDLYDKKQILKVIKQGGELTISNFNSLFLLNSVCGTNNVVAKIHICTNTGMNRFGFSSLSDIKILVELLKKMQNIKVIGIFSHYFSGNNENFCKFQQNVFKNYLSLFELKFNKFPLIHLCATDGTLYNNFGDMVRIGYGIYRDNDFDTISLKTKILAFQKVRCGEHVGYNDTFISCKDMVVAIVAIGYGDGIMRNIAQKGYVIINDTLCKILAVCMDTMIVDVSSSKCKIFDDVIIIGKMKNTRISICDIASWCDTIGYEIIVRLSSRIKRKYLEGSRCKLYLENFVQEN